MVGKGEIARYEQFLLLPHCFQKACFPGSSKGVIAWEWVKPFIAHSQILTALKKKPSENNERKEETASYQHCCRK